MRLWVPVRRALSTGRTVDLCVVGSGLAGASLAALLQASPLTSALRIAVLDSGPLQQPPSQQTPSSAGQDAACRLETGLRTSAISVDSQRVLEDCGVWDEIQERGAAFPFHKMEVWDAVGGGGMKVGAHLLSPSSGEDTPHLAHMVDNHVMGQALLRKLFRCGESVLMRGDTKVTRIEGAYKRRCAGNTTTVTLSGSDSLQAKLVVGADGANSNVRSQMEVSVISHKYANRAVVRNVRHADNGTPGTAFQRFLPTGPLAILPTSPITSNVVWSTTIEEAHDLTVCSREEFTDRINHALFADMRPSFDHLHSPIARGVCEGLTSLATPLRDLARSSVTPPRILEASEASGSFPLQILHSCTYVGNRCVLVGDAAHVVHPLAGQGLNLGLADVRVLADLLLEAVRTGQDIGSDSLLQEYQQRRRLQNSMMLASLQGMKTLFESGSTIPLVPEIRSAGLSLFSALPFLQRFAMAQAGSR